MRIRRRYLLLKAPSKDLVEKIILEYLGVLGWAKATPFFVEGKELILSIDRKALENVRAAFALSSANIQVMKVSGTLKGLE